MIEENESLKEEKVNHTVENLESVGQMILGEIETIGGILTADPTTQAEGEFNVEVGALHHDSNSALAESEETGRAAATAANGEPDESNQRA